MLTAVSACVVVIFAVAGCASKPSEPISSHSSSAESDAPSVAPAPTDSTDPVAAPPTVAPPTVAPPTAAQVGPQCAAYAQFTSFQVTDLHAFEDQAVVSAVSAVPGGGVAICAFSGSDQYSYGGAQQETVAFWLPGGFYSTSGSNWIETVMTRAGYQSHDPQGREYWTKTGTNGSVQFSGDAEKTAMDDEPDWWKVHTWVVNLVAGDIRR